MLTQLRQHYYWPGMRQRLCLVVRLLRLSAIDHALLMAQVCSFDILYIAKSS